MDTDAFPIGHVADERHEFLETWRPSEVEGVRSGRDEEVGVFKGRYDPVCLAVSCLGRDHEGTVNGVTLGVISFEGDCHIQKNIKNYRSFIFEFSFEAPDEASEEALYR